MSAKLGKFIGGKKPPGGGCGRNERLTDPGPVYTFLTWAPYALAGVLAVVVGLLALDLAGLWPAARRQAAT